MRAVIQRVNNAAVRVENRISGGISKGLVVFVGIEGGDNETDIEYMVSKIINLRIFDDKDGNMNRSVKDVKGGILIVSQFTLLGDVRKGRRPSFAKAEKSETAKKIYKKLVGKLKKMDVVIEEGVFKADMEVELTNNGPVTILLDSRKVF